MAFASKAGRRAILLAIAALALNGAARSAEIDLNLQARAIRDVRSAALSPDAKTVAAVVRASTAEGGQTHIWLLPVDGSAGRQATFSTAQDEPGEHDPAWSTSGEALYFLAKRGKAAALHHLPTSGGEAQKLVIARAADGALTSGWGLDPGEAVEVQQQGFEISPNDKSILVLAADSDTAVRTADVKKKDDAVRFGRDDQKKARLYLVDAASGGAREIVLPDNADYARWSPSGDELVVVTKPASEDLGPAARVWRVRVADGAATRLDALPPTAHALLWTGAGLVLLAQCQEEAPPGCDDVFTYDFAAKALKDLTIGLKGSIAGQLVLEKGGSSLIAPIADGVRQRLARIDIATGSRTWLDLPEPVVIAVGDNRQKSGWVFVASGPLLPPSVFFARSLADAPVKLAAPPSTPPGWPATPSLTITWTNDALPLEGLLYLPKIKAGAKAPLVVMVHGGPAGVFQDRSYNLVNLFTAQGWAVLLTNPRGSLGYGAAFLAANKNDLGGGDFRDIMSGVDAALAKYPLDPKRMALVGYSYGGEIAAFAEGRTDRFTALVSGAPVTDQFSEYGMEGDSFYDRWYFGKPWDHFADAWRQSPLEGIARAKTPMLLVQGEDDTSDPLGQSLEMRRALEQAGVPVVMVSYPRETHQTLGAAFSANPTLEPWHGVDVRRRMISFLTDAFEGRPPVKN